MYYETADRVVSTFGRRLVLLLEHVSMLRSYRGLGFDPLLLRYDRFLACLTVS